MIFRRHEDADEWTLVADDGHDTPISIANLCADGFGFVVYWNDETGAKLPRSPRRSGSP